MKGFPTFAATNAETKETTFGGGTHGLRDSAGTQSASFGFRPLRFQDDCDRTLATFNSGFADAVLATV